MGAVTLFCSNFHLVSTWKKWCSSVLLGVASLGAYGLVLYSFGVFVGPIREETGWSYGSISAAFSLAILVSGIGATFTGRLLDRIGARPVLLGTLAIGSALLFPTASADSPILFIAGWGVGGGIIGAGLFYNLTMAVTIRLFETERPKAFAILTFLGGLASPIFFPLAGFMVEHWGWRDALRGLIGLLILCVLPAAVFITGGRSRESEPDVGRKKTACSEILEAFREPTAFFMIAAFSLSMSVLAAIQVHHVPMMTATGVALGAATALAGIRGFLSLPGRAFLSPVTKLMGVKGAIQIMYLAMAAGSLFLLLAGSAIMLWLFVGVSGLTFGLIVPLQGLYATEIFGEQRIGTLMGAQTTIIGLATAAGPSLLGLTVDYTGNYDSFLIATIIMTAGAMWLLARSKQDLERSSDDDCCPVRTRTRRETADVRRGSADLDLAD
jgi:MFS family permease